MAIFTPGAVIGQISGRVGGYVFSRNRGGSYVRNGSVPSTVVTEKALLYKSYLAAASQAWTALTDAERLSWTVWAQSKTSTNRLGRSISLNGQNWFVSLNSRLAAAGETMLTVPPVTSSPVGVVISAFTVDAGVGATQVTFTPAPLGANQKLWVRGAMVSSSAINNVENVLTTLTITAAAAASPLNLKTPLEDAFGALSVGATYVIECRVLDTDNGMVSGRAFARTTAVST